MSSKENYFPQRPLRYGTQHITEEDIRAVTKVLKSDFLTQGPAGKNFEKAFAEYVGSKYAVAVSNGTAALHISALCLGVKQSSRVITSPITFVATGNCVRFCGGDVFFADIESETGLLDLNSVKQLIESHPKGYFDGIIPVDFSGRAVDMEKFRELADLHDLWILEDAAHAPGAYFKDTKGVVQRSGNGQFADLAIFSFHPVKHIACGEGGMVTTNDKSLYDKLLTFRSHGITSNDEDMKNSKELAYGNGAIDDSEDAYPGWYMEMQNLGFNYRITDIQSALGLSQLSRAVAGINKRREIAKKYFTAFDGKPFIMQQSGIVEGHAYHLYILQVENRLGLYRYLWGKNIFTQIHYIPMHFMPYYSEQGADVNLPAAEQYYSRCISIPMYPTLKEEEVDYIIKSIFAFYDK